MPDSWKPDSQIRLGVGGVSKWPKGVGRHLHVTNEIQDLSGWTTQHIEFAGDIEGPWTDITSGPWFESAMRDQFDPRLRAHSIGIKTTDTTPTGTYLFRMRMVQNGESHYSNKVTIHVLNLVVGEREAHR